MRDIKRINAMQIIFLSALFLISVAKLMQPKANTHPNAGPSARKSPFLLKACFSVSSSPDEVLKILLSA